MQDKKRIIKIEQINHIIIHIFIEYIKRELSIAIISI